MATKINSKIVSFKVVKEEEPDAAVVAEEAANAVEHLHEETERPELLLGSTYKVKTPLSEHALYITINDIVLNPGTGHELRRPFEVFINSKSMDNFQWVVALTRVISAVFRKGGDSCFLVEELKAVFDPKGGYFKKGGKYMPSLVAEIGDAIESHMKMIGLLKDDGLDEHQQKLVDAKRAEYDAQQSRADGKQEAGEFPAGAQLCAKCSTQAVVMMDGCMTCLSCGDSKCG